MDIRLCCVEAGEGFPLVLLHGNGEDHTYFKRQMGPFSQHFRVISVDTRGHGESPRGTAPFTLEQFALWNFSPGFQALMDDIWQLTPQEQTGGALPDATCWASPTGATSLCCSP